MNKKLVIALVPLVFIGSCTIVAFRGCMMTDAAVDLPTHTRWGTRFSNVSYAENYNTIHFEGDLSREAFLEMVKEYDWTVTEIPAEGVRIRRFSGMLRDIYHHSTERDQKPRYPVVPLPPEGEDLIRIRNGLWSERLENDGGGHTIVFDEDRARAYIRISLR